MKSIEKISLSHPLFIFLFIFFIPFNTAFASEGVVLLHGLCRSAASMSKMADFLKQRGYVVLNYDYPSTTDTIENLSEKVISDALSHESLRECVKIHFVTHSMGGILVRSYFSRHIDQRPGRVVMIGPPNQGSEVVDKIGNWWVFKKINGPAGEQLGTSKTSVPNTLGPVTFELGVIAGDRSVNWINSFLINGPDDGKVSVERTKAEGMKAHIVVHAVHPLIMVNKKVLQYTLTFLQTGTFHLENQKN